MSIVLHLVNCEATKQYIGVHFEDIINEYQEIYDTVVSITLFIHVEDDLQHKTYSMHDYTILSRTKSVRKIARMCTKSVLKLHDFPAI